MVEWGSYLASQWLLLTKQLHDQSNCNHPPLPIGETRVHYHHQQQEQLENLFLRKTKLSFFGVESRMAQMALKNRNRIFCIPPAKKIIKRNFFLVVANLRFLDEL